MHERRLAGTDNSIKALEQNGSLKIVLNSVKVPGKFLLQRNLLLRYVIKNYSKKKKQKNGKLDGQEEEEAGEKKNRSERRRKKNLKKCISSKKP